MSSLGRVDDAAAGGDAGVLPDLAGQPGVGVVVAEEAVPQAPAGPSGGGQGAAGAGDAGVRGHRVGLLACRAPGTGRRSSGWCSMRTAGLLPASHLR